MERFIVETFANQEYVLFGPELVFVVFYGQEKGSRVHNLFKPGEYGICTGI